MFVCILLMNLVIAKYKVIYSNDNGYPGCDGDNPQALVHFLFYANDIDIQLIIASGSTNCYKEGQNINSVLNIINVYKDDYNKLNSSSVNSGGNPYPTAEYLQSISVQGCNHSAPYPGYPSNDVYASQRIIDVVDALETNEYVYYGAGAGLCELSKALNMKPSIANKIRLYSIGSWNTAQDPYAREYIFNEFSDKLWWIESNTTFSGWYSGGNQSGNYGNENYDTNIIGYGGNLGKFYESIIPSHSNNNKPMFQEGDSPCYFYVIDPEHINRNISDPTQPNWGGQYKQIYNNKPLFYGDYSSYGDNSVNQWRVDYLNDWTKRLNWLN